MKPSLNQRIQHFYDCSTPLWLNTWGEHMHHGFYGADGSEKKDHRQAQIDLMEEMLLWGGIERAGRVLDAGCGVGGSARYLADRYGSSVLGLTLSPVQAENARSFTAKAGLDTRVRFQVRDMMTLEATDGPFDLIWSMESAEHIADKEKLFSIFFNLLAPGGKFLMATWCHRPVPPVWTGPEQRLLDKICRLYHLPPLVSRPTLSVFAAQAGFSEVTSVNWSQAVAPFWAAVIKSALDWRSIGGLFKAGWTTIKGAWAMRYMQQGFRKGLLEFAIIQGRKL